MRGDDGGDQSVADMREMDEFWNDVAMHCGFTEGSALYKPLMEDVARKLSECLESAAEEDKPTWSRLLAMAEEKLKAS